MSYEVYLARRASALRFPRRERSSRFYSWLCRAVRR